MRRCALWGLIIAACGAKDAGVRSEFHGITYVAPKGTSVGNAGVDRPSHYPDPKTGEVIEIPTRIEPAISLIMPDTNRFYVMIKKPPERVTLEGMKFSIAAQPGVSQVDGHAEPDGWSVSYVWKNPDGTTSTIFTRRYVFADSDYECGYDSGNSRDVEAAKRICASLRPKS